jgi:cell division protein ZapA
VDQQIIKIELFGQAYSFRADANANHVERVARYLVEEVNKAEACAKVPSKLDTMILAALNIANDYFEMKVKRETLLEKIDQRCEALINEIDAEVEVR